MYMYNTLWNDTFGLPFTVILFLHLCHTSLSLALSLSFFLSLSLLSPPILLAIITYQVQSK